MNLDLSLLERWLTGWSLARELPLPSPFGGGSVVEVGWPEQVRRHVFTDAERAPQACARHLHAPLYLFKSGGRACPTVARTSRLLAY